MAMDIVITMAMVMYMEDMVDNVLERGHSGIFHNILSKGERLRLNLEMVMGLVMVMAMVVMATGTAMVIMVDSMAMDTMGVGSMDPDIAIFIISYT